MHNPSSATTNDAFTVPITTADGSYPIPQQGTLAIVASALDGGSSPALRLLVVAAPTTHAVPLRAGPDHR